MANLTIRPYVPADKPEWDTFVKDSINATFLHTRDYMDYHAERFTDCSLMAYHSKYGLVALLPANRSHDVVTSHAGLTYGGLLVGQRITTPMTMQVMEMILEHYRLGGAARFVYKPIPHIYHRVLFEADLYAIWRLGAVLTGREASTVLDGNMGWQGRRERTVKQARVAGLRLRTDHRHLCEFWGLLSQNLRDRHSVSPVHTVDEMLQLHQQHNAICFEFAFSAAEMVAGAVLYSTPKVLHVQYMATSGEGRELGALDWLLSGLVRRYGPPYQTIDLGISTENGGRVLNEGLINYKEGFGGTTVNYDTWGVAL